MPARSLVAALALTVLAAPLAAKPGMPLDADQTVYRTQSIALCTRQLGEVPGAHGDDVEALCSCAADRLIAGRDRAVLPAYDPAGMPPAMRTDVLRCLGEVRPAAAGALAAAALRPPGVVPPPLSPSPSVAAGVDKPVPGDEAAAPVSPTLSERFDLLFDRLAGSGLPRWAWGLIALGGFLVLRRLFRRPERDDDLMGAPRPDRYRNLPRY